jgi:hypothetical protein
VQALSRGKELVARQELAQGQALAVGQERPPGQPQPQAQSDFRAIFTAQPQPPAHGIFCVPQALPHVHAIFTSLAATLA